MTFLIWERKGVFGVGWIFLGVSSFHCTQASFPTAAQSHNNVMENSRVASKLGRESLLIPWQRGYGISRYPDLGNRMLFLPWGSTQPCAEELAPFEFLLICCASLCKEHTNRLDLFLFIREEQTNKQVPTTYQIISKYLWGIYCAPLVVPYA